MDAKSESKSLYIRRLLVFTLKVKMTATIIFVIGFIAFCAIGGGVFGHAESGGFQWGNTPGPSVAAAVYQ